MGRLPGSVEISVCFQAVLRDDTAMKPTLSWRLLGAAPLLIGQAIAQELGTPPAVPPEAAQDQAWTGMLLFWSGAVVIMYLVGRVVFREQLTQLRTQRMLIRQIGPFFPEFDTDFLTAWVNRLAPHLWRAWQTHDLSAVVEFVTPGFLAEIERRYAQEATEGLKHEVTYERILRAHYLGLYAIGAGPPPNNLELVLRLETKAVHVVRDADGKVVAGQPGMRQIQHFWTLRHDGHRWRLHQVEPATGDRTDLGKKPLPPPLMEWRRPPVATLAPPAGAPPTTAAPDTPPTP